MKLQKFKIYFKLFQLKKLKLEMETMDFGAIKTSYFQTLFLAAIQATLLYTFCAHECNQIALSTLSGKEKHHVN